MSFICILKKVGSVALGIEHVAAPILEAAVPGLAPVVATVDGLVQRIQNTITTVEANGPVSGGGQLKSAAVVSDFQSAIDLASTIAGLEGKTMTYDQQALQDAITAQVAAYNAFAKLKASFALTAKPAAPAA